MRTFRFLFVLVVMIVYGIMYTAQSIDSREKKREIVKLTHELETLNARKQELTVLIEAERVRLVEQARNKGKILTTKDVVIID